MIESRKPRMSNGWFAVSMLAGLALVMAPAIMLAATGNIFAGGGFDAVVGGIELRYHTHATKIPFMGLMSGIAGIATHGSVRGMHVAEFEHFDAPIDGTELTTLIEKHAGKDWHRMIRETSRNSADQTLIYVRDEHNHMGMLVVDRNGNEMDVVQISVNPDQLGKEIAKHERHHDHDGDSDKSKDKDSDKSTDKDSDKGDSE